MASQFDSWESYFYPDTIDPDTGIGTLRNLYEERDARVLSRMEYTDTTVRAVQLGNGEVEIPRTFDGAHLRAIHGHLFQDVYEWAGEYRTVEMSKGPGRGFGEVRSGEVDRYLSDARQLVTSTDWAKISRNDFVATASTVFAYVNQAHPFREGNGRSMRIWLDLMLKNGIGQVVDWSKVDKEDYLLAMERSPIKDVEIKVLLKVTLTDDINSREVYMKGI